MDEVGFVCRSQAEKDFELQVANLYPPRFTRLNHLNHLTVSTSG
jgi:hypothetical protein